MVSVSAVCMGRLSSRLDLRSSLVAITAATTVTITLNGLDASLAVTCPSCMREASRTGGQGGGRRDEGGP